MSTLKIRSWFFVIRYMPLKAFVALWRFVKKRQHNPAESLELEWDHDYSPGVAWRMAVSLCLILRRCSSEKIDWFINYLDGEESGSLSSEEILKTNEIVMGATALDKVESEVVGIVVGSESKDFTAEIWLGTIPSSPFFLWCNQA